MEKIAMTPKIRGVRPMLDKLKEAMAADVDKLAVRIVETDTMRTETFKASHAALDDTQSGLKEVRDYLEDLKKSNGGDPLDSEEQSGVTAPRSSDVAQQ